LKPQRPGAKLLETLAVEAKALGVKALEARGDWRLKRRG